MDPWEVHNHRQALHHVAVHKPLPAVATRPLAAGLRNNLGCCTLDLREENTRVVLGCCWQSMAEGEHLYIELVRGLPVWLLRPSLYHGRVSDQGGDVGVL